MMHYYYYYKIIKLQYSNITRSRFKYPVYPTIHMTETNASNCLPANSALVLYYNYILLFFFFILRYFLLCHLKPKSYQLCLWSYSCCSSVFTPSSLFLWHLSGSFHFVISFSTWYFPFSFILKTFQGIKSLSSLKMCVLIYWAVQIILKCFELVYLFNFYYLQALNINIFQAVKSRWKKGTSVIIFPRVLLRSRWFAFFSNCCSTRSRVVRYSSENSDTMRQNSFGFVSATRCSGIPSQSRNLWNLRTPTRFIQTDIFISQNVNIQAGLILCQGYIPVKCYTTQTQNSNLKQDISWGCGLTASSYIVYEPVKYVCTAHTVYIHFPTVCIHVYTIYLFMSYAVKMQENHIHSLVWFIPMGLW